jgi:hypothetical protein
VWVLVGLCACLHRGIGLLGLFAASSSGSRQAAQPSTQRPSPLDSYRSQILDNTIVKLALGIIKMASSLCLGLLVVRLVVSLFA